MEKQPTSLIDKIGIVAVTKLLEASSWCFSAKQRKAIVERDQIVGIKLEGNKNGCQFPYPHDCSGRIHVHHFLPEMYQRAMGIPNPDTPDVAISLCDNIHVGKEGIRLNGPHPDQPHYLDAYRRGDKEAFKKMQHDRKEKIEEKVIYWNPVHDREFMVIARRNNQKFEAIKGREWFPEKK